MSVLDNLGTTGLPVQRTEDPTVDRDDRTATGTSVPASGRADAWKQRYRRTLILVDLFVGALAIPLLAVLPTRYYGTAQWVAVAVFPLVWVTVLALARAYDDRVFGIGADEFRRVMNAGIGVIATVAFVAYALDWNLARSLVLVVFPVTIALDIVARYGLRKSMHRARGRGLYLKRVVLVGDDRAVIAMVEQLRRVSFHGLVPVAACLTYGSDVGRVEAAGLKTFIGLERAVWAAEETSSDVVAVLTGPLMNGTMLRRLSWELEGRSTELLVSTGLVEVAGPRVHVAPIDGLPLLVLDQPRFSGLSRVVKGVLDRTCAVLAMAVLAPVFLTLALLVRLSSTGPVFYRQKRIGRDGSSFTMLKFRSMVADADDQRLGLLDRTDRDGLMFKMHDDPRVTRIGRLLRRYSLDEMPQLINIARGQMSLVGPRPPLPEEVAEYDDHVYRRLRVKPGLTGLWQISGRADLSWEESVRLDLRYVDNWSVALDVFIVWKTVRAVVRGAGAY